MTERQRSDPRLILLAGVLIVTGALVAYSNSFGGPFVLDDITSIPGNPTIRHLWPPNTVLHPPRGAGLTVEGRPVLNISFAVNYAISETAVWSYHLFNLLIHAAAGLTLFGIIRRSLDSPPNPLPVKSWLFAGLAALLWTLHPLQTESVTYIVQRAESLMGLFYLMTLYCFIRGTEGGPGARLWYACSVAACALGMATKEVMVSAPLIVFLYDGLVVAGFAEAWEKRRKIHGLLASTWVILAFLVAQTGNRGATSGFGSGVQAPDYWLTQFPALLRYVRLSFWPQPLVFDYGTQWIQSAAEVFPGAILLLTITVAIAISWRRFPRVAFLGVCFLAILAPTSLIPGNRQTAAEHRMYLALAPLLVAALAGLAALSARLFRVQTNGKESPAGTVAFVLVSSGAAAACLLLTLNRNRVYQSVLALQMDTVAKVPSNPFAQSNLGLALFDTGRIAEAMPHFAEAIRLKADYPVAEANLGVALLKLGRPAEAVPHFHKALELNPNFAKAETNLGAALQDLGQLAEAVPPFEAAVRLKPSSSFDLDNLGDALLRAGRPSESVAFLEEAWKLDSSDPQIACDLGNAYSLTGHPAKAIESYRTALRLKPDYVTARYNLGAALQASGMAAEAASEFHRVLELDPANSSAREALQRTGVP